VLDLTRRRALEWGTATTSHADRRVSGDVAVVVPTADGALLAAIDGLGRGEEAVHAALAARAMVLETADSGVVPIAQRCHRAMARTRGAAVALACVSTLTSTFSWLGVGTVAGRLVTGDRPRAHAKASLDLRRGVLGDRLPTLEPVTFAIGYGDVLILATDGIAARFADELDVTGTPRDIAERIVSSHWNGTDDAVVVVLRYLGTRT
jgi:negative regulator of sigma-B (phosphoserine phosphatase)